MAYRPSTLVQWSWEHPPSCLSTVVVKPLKSGARVEEHNAFAHFALSCQCGASAWHVLGHIPEPDLFLCPLSLRCSGCTRVAMIFDVETHGYDAELGNGCSSRRAEGNQVELACAKCRGAVFGATAIVSYQFEESEFDGEERSKIHDLFDVFALGVLCQACGHATTVCDYECA